MLERVLLTVKVEGCCGCELILGKAESLEANLVDKALREVLLHAIHVNAVVRALWSRK